MKKQNGEYKKAAQVVAEKQAARLADAVWRAFWRKGAKQRRDAKQLRSRG